MPLISQHLLPLKGARVPLTNARSDTEKMLAMIRIPFHAAHKKVFKKNEDKV